MHSFKDAAGREWNIAINGWQLKKVKQKLQFDARDPAAIMEAANDPLLLCDVLFVLCEEQAKAVGVTDKEFGEGLAGDVIDNATEAYLQESADFFPQRQRQALKAMLAKMTDFRDRMAANAEQKIAGPEIEAAIQAAMAKTNQEIDQLLAGTSIGV